MADFAIPAGLTARPYEVADAAAAAALINLREQAVGGYPGMTAELLRSYIATSVQGPRTDTRVVVAPDGELVALAVVPTPPSGGFRVDLWGAVHPAQQGRGVGRALLGWQLARSAAIHRATAPDARWEAHVDTPLGDEAAQRLFRRFGMAAGRYWFEMEAATAGAPSPPVPDGLRLVDYMSTLDKEVYDAHMEAFQDHWGFQRGAFDRWMELTVGSQLFLPELSRVALDGDQVAGYALAYREAGPGRLYVGHVGVRRPWRRRGLAAAMLAEVLRAAARAGMPVATLAVDAASPTGAVGVYERVGFTVHNRAVTYVMPLP